MLERASALRTEVPKIGLPAFELHYEEGGTGSPVVYVHGGFPNLAMMLRTQDPLAWTWELDFAAHFRFIWFDRRGCYRSSLPTDGFGLEKQATDIQRLLDHLGLRDVHLIGSSAGGPIAILFASVFPKRVASLILVGTGLELFPIGDRPSDLIRDQLLIVDRDGPVVAFDKRPAGAEASLGALWEREQAKLSGTLIDFERTQQQLTRLAKQVPTDERARWYVAELTSIRAYMEADVRARAALVETPALVIHGSEDSVVPVHWAEDLAEAIPNSALRIVDGGGHGLMSRDARVRALAIDFITS